jgi:hypothetical protein
MGRVTLMIQNVSGSGLGKVRGGGNVASLRVSVHCKKPDFLILPETRIENRDYTGRGVFRGYDLTQHSSSGHRRAGVAVFARKSIEIIAGTLRNSRDGHSTVAGYTVNGNKLIMAALYGPSCNDDNLAAEMLRGVEETMGELGQLVGTRNFIMAGDFNIKLQTRRRQTKPRAKRVLNEIMQRFELMDMGAKGDAPTWRRPHLPGSNSRIDYILHSEGLTALNYVTSWGRFDHAEIQGHFELGDKRDRVNILKDWVLLTPEFLEDAPKLLEDVLLDHDKDHRQATKEDRDRFTQGRLPRAYEAELHCSEKEEGITHAHVLMLALGKLTRLQGQVQKAHVTRRRRKLEEMQREIGHLYEEADRAAPGPVEQDELVERLEELKTQLRDDTEQVERASRI